MRYHGKNGQVSLGPLSPPGTATPVASLNHWTLNAKTDKSDVTAFGDPNKQYVQGLKDLQGTLAGWFDDTEDALFAAADAGVPVQLELMPVSTVSGIKWAGPAYVDASIDVPANGPITVSGDFVAAGAWTKTWTVSAASAPAEGVKAAPPPPPGA